MVKIHTVLQALRNGGVVRFTHKTCTPELIFAASDSEVPERIDGRSYQAFLEFAGQLKRSETGSLETGDLVIEWRLNE